jgi:serine protease
VLKRRMLSCLIPLGLLASLDAAAIEPASRAAAAPAWSQATDRIIVKYRDDTAPGLLSSYRELAARASRQSGLGLGHLRRLHNGVHVFKLPQAQDLSSVGELLRRLRRDPNVLYAEPDYRMHILQTPDDPRYGEQWHYHQSAGGMNLPAAWDKSTGAGAVVAVVDTGVLAHAELAAQLLPGYDFISDAKFANDGDGRDADASDAGDWTNVGDCGYNSPSRDYPSSWHGTHVAGTVAAASNNGIGVAGVAWQARLLPVRVLGKCGGYTSDIVDGMRWAAGLSVPGVPANPNRAQVLNLSLGGGGSCSYTYRNAISEIRTAGTAVVVAAGNESKDAYYSTPANCPGVIAVAATDRKGGLAYYSNYGSTVDVSAPGGELSQGDESGGVLSTYNSGQTSPGGDSYGFLQGTSMAAPHVAGAIALLYAAKPGLTPDEAEQTLKDNARAFPALFTSDRCSTSKCGAGIVDAEAAVLAVQGGGRTVDATAPAVNLNSPSHGTTVSGIVSISAAASDDVGVTRVEFYAGGKLIGTDTSAPYTYSWDTTALANGNYTLMARAYDAAGNFASDDDTTVTVSNTTSGWACKEHYSSNYYHVKYGRATNSWGYVYAKGSRQYMGYNSIYLYTRLAETDSGYFEIGSCP